MLTRKPRIGEVLTFQSPGNKAHDVAVKRFSDVHPSILYATFPDSSVQEFIWEFHDGLNLFLSHKEA